MIYFKLYDIEESPFKRILEYHVVNYKILNNFMTDALITQFKCNKMYKIT